MTTNAAARRHRSHLLASDDRQANEREHAAGRDDSFQGPCRAEQTEAYPAGRYGPKRAAHDVRHHQRASAEPQAPQVRLHDFLKQGEPEAHQERGRADQCDRDDKEELQELAVEAGQRPADIHRLILREVSVQPPSRGWSLENREQRDHRNAGVNPNGRLQ